MIYDDLKLYLKNNLETPSLKFNWTDEDNKNFFNFMDKNTSSDFLHKKENLLKVKEIFSFYFQPVGYILFKINTTTVRVKVFPYTVEAQESKNISEIINIIDENKDSIVRGYNGQDNQIYIKDKLRNDICAYTQTIKNEKVNSKELVRFSVRKALELKNEDLIMLKQDCIFIKLCDLTKKNRVPKDKQNTIVNRYNGISEEEMISFNKEHFSNQANKVTKTFFMLSAKLFVETYFFKNNINNNDYEKNVFAYIHLTIMKQLINKFDNCEDFFKGFAGYLFRMNFEEIFENIAEIILAEIATSNENMINFLKYYSLNIIIIDNKKYKVPSLETEDGLKWNVSSMISIVRVYIKAKLNMKFIQDSIDKKNSEIMSLCIDGLSPAEYSNNLEKEKNKLVDLLIENEHTLDKYYDSLQLSKSENEKDELKEEIDLIKKHMQELREDKKILLNKSIKRIDINKFISLEHEVNTMNRTFAKDKKILDQNENSFQSIKNALFNALIAKKYLL